MKPLAFHKPITLFTDPRMYVLPQRSMNRQTENPWVTQPPIICNIAQAAFQIRFPSPTLS